MKICYWRSAYCPLILASQELNINKRNSFRNVIVFCHWWVVSFFFFVRPTGWCCSLGKRLTFTFLTFRRKEKSLHRRLFQPNSRILLVAGVSLFLTATVGLSHSLTYRESDMHKQPLRVSMHWVLRRIRHPLWSHQPMKSSLRNDPSPSIMHHLHAQDFSRLLSTLCL